MARLHEAPGPTSPPKNTTGDLRRPSLLTLKRYVVRLASDLPDVAGLQTLRSAAHVEFDRLTLGERAEAVARDRAVVDEYVLTALLGDETETLRFVEPLHRTTC